MTAWIKRAHTAAAAGPFAPITLIIVATAWCALPGSARGAPPAGEDRVAPAQAPAAELHVSTELIRKHIEYLASPELEGRGGGRGKQLARKYIVDQFRELQLEPLFGDQYEQDVPGPAKENGAQTVVGRNLGAILRGTDPKLRDEVIIVSAHYDHLGIQKGEIYPGANDNASSVAMVLETARVLATAKVRPRRSVAFVCFDLEERLLWGSRWLAAHPPVARENIKLFITAEMLGRTLGDLPLPVVFVMGSEHGTGLRAMVDAVPVPHGLEAAHLGVDLVGTRSDYGPFQSLQIPFLFFSGGEFPGYHEPTDTADRIDHERVARISEFILGAVRRAGGAAELPTWTDETVHGLDEIAAIHRITTELLKRDELPDSVKLTLVQKALVSNVHTRTKQILDRGTVDPKERPWLIRSSQLLLLSVF